MYLNVKLIMIKFLKFIIIALQIKILIILTKILIL